MSKRLLLGQDRQAERQTQQRLQTRVANLASNRFSREIASATRAAARQFSEDGSDIGLSGALAGHRGAMETILREEWARAARTAGDRVLAATKSHHGDRWIRKNTPQDAFWAAMNGWIAARAGMVAGLLALTTANDVRRVIGRDAQAGDSVDTIARNLLQLAPGLGLRRGMMIARTESHGAYQAGHQASAEASQLQLAKEWVSATDERTRDEEFDHVSADGEVVGLQDFFLLTGEGLQYPGDPAGSPGNIIYCRCGRVDVLL